MLASKELVLGVVQKQLESDILTGLLRPRERLTENDLMRRFNVNRHTIRKIFHDLQLKGLLRHFPNRGVVVADLSEKDIRNIYSVQIVLETHAADLVFERMTKEQLLGIAQSLREFKKAVRERNFEKMVLANIAFHDRIFQVSDNEVLSAMIRQLATRSHLVRADIWRLPGELQKSIDAHEHLVKALEKKDVRSFKRINASHTMGGVRRYLNLIKLAGVPVRLGLFPAASTPPVQEESPVPNTNR